MNRHKHMVSGMVGAPPARRQIREDGGLSRDVIRQPAQTGQLPYDVLIDTRAQCTQLGMVGLSLQAQSIKGEVGAPSSACRRRHRARTIDGWTYLTVETTCTSDATPDLARRCGA